MINLILKDYRFTWKQVLIGIAFCLATPTLLMLDGGEQLYAAQFLVPFSLVTFVLGKIFLKEDSVDVRYFLKLLPYSVYKRVLARFCFMSITLIITEIYLGISQYFIFKQPLLYILKSNAIPIIIFFLYFSMYIMLAYCFGYFTAQNSIYVCAILVGILALAYERLGFNINFERIATPSIVAILAVFGIIIIMLFYYLACKGDIRREN